MGQIHCGHYHETRGRETEASLWKGLLSRGLGTQNLEEALRPTSPFLGARTYSPPPPLQPSLNRLFQPFGTTSHPDLRPFNCPGLWPLVFDEDAEQIWVPVTQVTLFRHSHGGGRGTGKVAACLGPPTARPHPPTGCCLFTPQSPQKQLLSEYKPGGSGSRLGLGAGLTLGTGQGASPRMRRALG